MRRAAAVAAIALSTFATQAPAATLSSNPAGDSTVVFRFPELSESAPFLAALRPAGGVFGRAVRITPRNAPEADVATGPSGAAVATWTHKEGTRESVHASFREPGAGWGPPVTLAQGGAATHAAIDGQGAALVVWSQDDGAMRSAYRPPGGPFERPRALPGSGTVDALQMDAAGDALVLSFLNRSGDDAVVRSSYRPAGGEFTDARTVATVSRFDYAADLAMTASGDAMAVFTQGPGLVASRRPAGGDFGAAVPITRKGSQPWPDDLCGSTRVHDVALAGDGSAAVTWSTTSGGDGDTCFYSDYRVFAALAPGSGSFERPIELNTPDHPAFDARVAADERGDVAIAWGDPRFSVHAIYRPAGGAFGDPIRLVGPRLGGSPDVSIEADGRATAAWQQNDGEQVRFVARELSAEGRAGPAKVLRAAPAFKHLSHPRARCHPPGTRTLLETRYARVYRNLRNSFHPKYGCLLRRGKPIAIDYGFDDFPVSAAPPPAIALAGPLVAYSYFNEECGVCGGQRGLTVLDLRTGHTANGFGPNDDPDPLVDDFGPIRSLVLRRDTALAYILCEGSRRNDCRKPGVTSFVYKMDSGAAAPVRIAKGKGIDPRFLRLAGGRVRWRDHGHARSAPLRSSR